MVAGCRTSGVLTASAVVARHQCKLISIHATETAGAMAQIKVFDGTDNSGLEVARIILAAGQTLEFDMHGVIMSEGIFYEETTGNGSVFINFA